MDGETPEAASRTVFVRGISYAVAQDALEEAFGAVGPVRKCFLVKSKTEDKHKGYGYVQFALREDAASAVAQLHNSSLGGRKLKVGVAAALSAGVNNATTQVISCILDAYKLRCQLAHPHNAGRLCRGTAAPRGAKTQGGGAGRAC